MMFKDIFDVKWNYKTISLLLFLVFVPNLLGMINISTPFGFKLHFFQLAVIIAAMVYGPMGGLLSGMFGSVYSAMMMNNPYIVVGNVIPGQHARGQHGRPLLVRIDFLEEVHSLDHLG